MRAPALLPRPRIADANVRSTLERLRKALLTTDCTLQSVCVQVCMHVYTTVRVLACVHCTTLSARSHDIGYNLLATDMTAAVTLFYVSLYHSFNIHRACICIYIMYMYE